MQRPFGTPTGFDQSWVLQDQVSAGDREVKYTVDAVGIELLRYPDSVTPALRAQDRRARRLSRGLAMLPGSVSSALVRQADRAVQLTDRFSDWLLEGRTRHRSVGRARLVLVGSALTAHRAAEVAIYDAVTEAREQHVLVLAALRGAGVGAVVVPAGPDKRIAVAVRGCDVDRAATALTALDRSWHVAHIDAPQRRPRRVTRRNLQRLCNAHGGFRLFRLTAGGPGQQISGVEVGVDVEVWRDPMPGVADREAVKRGLAAPRVEGDGRLAATRRQAWTQRLSADAWSEAAARDDADLWVSPLPHLFDVTEPIDVVYTWVDGADPAWNEARVAALGYPQEVTLQHAATHAARFRSHDELRYSLRSLEMFAPWVHTVHIVTAGQTPYWLDTAHPRVNLVDHREIFPERNLLPVFNSHAIESRLHRIPGLAERYLYLNDDVFFGRPVSPDLFFHGNGLAKFFPSSALIDHGPREAHDNPVTSAAKNNRELIAGVFGRTTTTIFQHTPHPQLRSVLEHMEEAHPEVFARVAASKFRHPDDLSISSALHHYYAYALGKAVPARLEYLYLDLGHPRAASRLRRVLRGREFDVLCLNDSPDASGDDHDSDRLLRSFLPRYFPLASTFELAARAAEPRDQHHPEPSLSHQHDALLAGQAARPAQPRRRR
ncbi:MAG: stealth family protein [Acidimicrobiia bacterium]|nr:stealth family protein [Acidimicrobiia bacterium]